MHGNESRIVPNRPRLAFIYGSREVIWPGIAHYLFAEKGVIRDTLIRCERLIRARLNWSLEKVAGAEHFPSPNIQEPLLAAFQIALTEAWRERGVEPDVIAARSGGETAAEYARGTLTLEDAIEIACRTSQLMSDGRGAGRMLTIELGLVEAERLKQFSPVNFWISADTWNDATIISCAKDSVSEIKEFLKAQQIEHHTIRFDTVPHTPLTEEWKTVLLKPLIGKTSGTSGIPYYSAGADGPDRGTSYPTRLWRSARAPALVGRMVKNLIADGCNVFLEIGGQVSLADMIQRRANAAGKKVVTLATMLPRESPRVVMNKTQKSLRQLGVSIRPRRTAKGWFEFARW